MLTVLMGREHEEKGEGKALVVQQMREAWSVWALNSEETQRESGLNRSFLKHLKEEKEKEW